MADSNAAAGTVELQRSYAIDPKRIYATAAGGFFSNRLACDLTGQIAAIAAVAATMAEPLVPVCKPSRPISVLFNKSANKTNIIGR